MNGHRNLHHNAIIIRIEYPTQGMSSKLILHSILMLYDTLKSIMCCKFILINKFICRHETLADTTESKKKTFGPGTTLPITIF
jgi:hypothetical protein